MSIISISLGQLVTITLMAILILGSTLRLTRLVTSDTLGGWLLRDPADAWAARAERARRIGMVEAVARAADDARESGIPFDSDVAQLVEHWTAQIESNAPITRRGRLVSGLHCPFCVGFWIGAAIVGGTAAVIALALGWLTAVWLCLLVALTFNYMAGHLSAKLD